MPTHSLLPQSVLKETLGEMYGTDVPFLETPYLHVGRDFDMTPDITQTQKYPLLGRRTEDGVLSDFPRTMEFTGKPFPFLDGTYEDAKDAVDKDVDAELFDLFPPPPPPRFYELSSADRERMLQQNINSFFEREAQTREDLVRDALQREGLTPDEVDGVLRQERLDAIMAAVRNGQPLPRRRNEFDDFESARSARSSRSGSLSFMSETMPPPPLVATPATRRTPSVVGSPPPPEYLATPVATPLTPLNLGIPALRRVQQAPPQRVARTPRLSGAKRGATSPPNLDGVAQILHRPRIERGGGIGLPDIAHVMGPQEDEMLDGSDL